MKHVQFGDYQTPPELVDQIIGVLINKGYRWERVLEPTCGKGNFIQGLQLCAHPAKEIVGIELQEEYWKQASRQFCSSVGRVSIIHDSIFSIVLKEQIRWNCSGPLLIIGNPPWVTNAQISGLNGNNLPEKKNIKGCRGIEALTGSSNFDIAESIIIRLIHEYQSQKPLFAFLCKTSVARNILRYAYQAGIELSDAEIRMIDSRKWFSAAVDACLFIFTSGRGRNYTALLYSEMEGRFPVRTIGYVGDHYVSNIEAYNNVAFIEGRSPIEWRQGIKHDAASIMELQHTPEGWKNGFAEIVDVEDCYIYPLLKSSDIQSIANKPFIKRGVIVPQKEAYIDTAYLCEDAPRLWHYLNRYIEQFNSRKSSIYRNKPPFSVFGLGPYSFSPYKVIVSGLYKCPTFAAVSCFNRKPVFCDDTCYLLPCNSALQAATIETLLNHTLARQYIESIAFLDSKRPITKAVLKRLNYSALLKHVPENELCEQVIATVQRLSGDSVSDNLCYDDILFCMNTKSDEQELLFNI